MGEIAAIVSESKQLAGQGVAEVCGGWGGGGGGGGLNTIFDCGCVGGMFTGPDITSDPPLSPSQGFHERLLRDCLSETSLCLLNTIASEWVATRPWLGPKESSSQIYVILYSSELNRRRPDIVTRRAENP